LLNAVEILGSCFFAPGLGKESLEFNMGLTSIMSSLMLVASVSLVVPTALDTFDTSLSHSGGYVLALSRITSIILLLFYLMYLYFQLGSHAHLFQEDNDAEANEDEELGFWASIVVLVISTLGVTQCSDYLVDSVDGVVEASGVSRTFIGLIIVPIVGNAGEFFAAVSMAMKGKLDLAISMIVGATLQIALFVTPFMVILGWIFDIDMSLRFETFETIVFYLAVLVVNSLVQDGRTNYFEGAMLIGT
jgi:calcium/proton exchanger cax